MSQACHKHTKLQLAVHLAYYGGAGKKQWEETGTDQGAYHKGAHRELKARSEVCLIGQIRHVIGTGSSHVCRIPTG